MTALELKPCPFCGKVAHLWDDVFHTTDFFVGCETLRCFGNALWGETKEEAVSNWNTRADIADALVAAAYEAAAITAKSDGESEWFNPVQAIRALTPNDAKAALEAVRREARAEALREAAESCDTFDGPVSDSDFVTGQSTAAQQIRSAILALLDNPQDDET